MPRPAVETPKKAYAYRADPDLQKKAKKKAAKEKITLSSKMEELMRNWVEGFHP